MLALCLITCLATAVAQDPPSIAGAVAVRGEAELSPAEAFASAQAKAEDLVRGRLTERAERAAAALRPFWVPEPFAERAVARWLAEQSLDEVVKVVDREDRTRDHEFGQSFQTTLWFAEEPRQIAAAERQLKRRLQALERTTAARFGGTIAVWLLLGILVAWLDRLSRGYMTGRLRAIGLFGGVAIPALFFVL